LIVEVDGDLYHQQRASADAARDRKLVRAGYTVVRIPASLVERDLGAATALVQRALR
jgi:very-short-patch-repair endonuclease